MLSTKNDGTEWQRTEGRMDVVLGDKKDVMTNTLTSSSVLEGCCVPKSRCVLEGCRALDGSWVLGDCSVLDGCCEVEGRRVLLGADEDPPCVPATGASNLTYPNRLLSTEPQP